MSERIAYLIVVLLIEPLAAVSAQMGRLSGAYLMEYAKQLFECEPHPSDKRASRARRLVRWLIKRAWPLLEIRMKASSALHSAKHPMSNLAPPQSLPPVAPPGCPSGPADALLVETLAQPLPIAREQPDASK